MKCAPIPLFLGVLIFVVSATVPYILCMHIVKRSLVTWRIPGALPICHSTRAAVNAGSCFVSPVKDSASHRSVHWEGVMLSTGKKF